MKKFKCELCGAESEYVKSNCPPEWWKTVVITVSYNNRIMWDLCPECSGKLDFNHPVPTNEEVLMEAMREMITEISNEPKD